MNYLSLDDAVGSRVKKILILDNKKAIVEMIREVMLAQGYEAKGVIVADGFINRVKRYKPDLVLMDYNLLSRFNGVELCHQIKINVNTAHIPVILISAYPLAIDPLNYHGPDALIHKPFSLEELTENVKNLISLKTQKILPIVNVN